MTVITTLDNARFEQLINDLKIGGRIWVGFSGGADSTALLYVFSQWANAHPNRWIGALHIHHGLHPDANAWATHCRAVASELTVAYHEERIDARPTTGESPEAAARRARYDIVAPLLGEEDAFCTAHHADDQAETVLIQLIRGSGPHGLAGMPGRRRLGQGWLCRPLLNVSKQALTDVANNYRIDPVHDPSNTDPSLARAFVRHQLMPLLKQRSPGIVKVLVRNARWQREAANALNTFASIDLAMALDPDENTLNCDALATLSPTRAREVIRLWLRESGQRPPRSNQIQQWLSTVLSAAADRAPLMQVGTIDIRRYRKRLYLIQPPLKPTVDSGSKCWQWTPPCPLTLPFGTLHAVHTKGPGLLRLPRNNPQLTVRFRRGGERLRLAEDAKTRTLKALWQKHSIPPWERKHIPLVYRNEELIAVPGIGVSANAASTHSQSGWSLSWQVERPNRLKATAPCQVSNDNIPAYCKSDLGTSKNHQRDDGLGEGT